jgi:hypothetical protein
MAEKVTSSPFPVSSRNVERVETANWKLETGNWKLESGNWQLDAQIA